MCFGGSPTVNVPPPPDPVSPPAAPPSVSLASPPSLPKAQEANPQRRADNKARRRFGSSMTTLRQKMTIPKSFIGGGQSGSSGVNY